MYNMYIRTIEINFLYSSYKFSFSDCSKTAKMRIHAYFGCEKKGRTSSYYNDR